MKNYKVVILAFFGCFFQEQFLYAINPKLLLETSGILTEAMQYYSPCLGLAFTEGKMAENIYDFSAKQTSKHVLSEINSSVNPNINSPEIQLRKKSVIDWLDNKVNTKTEGLASLLFNRVGTFNITRAVTNPIMYLTPKDIGNVLRIVYEDLQKQGLDNRDAQVNDLLKGYLVDLKLNKQSGNSFAGKDYNPFITALLGSLEECKQGIYPKNTTQGLLLGYLLKKCNTNKDLEDYFSAFLKKDIVIPNRQYTDDDIQKLTQFVPDFNNFVKFGDYVCAIACMNYISDFELPTIVSNQQAIYDGMTFADCMETTMRNLCNIITYDAATKSLGNVIAQSPQLYSFYNKDKINSSILEVGNIKVHEDFASMVENIPGVAYNRLKLLGQVAFYYKCPDEYDGFMPASKIDAMLPKVVVSLPKVSATEQRLVDDSVTLQKKTIGTNNYLVVTKNINMGCYELMPTVSNMVIILNILFDLKLYDSRTQIKRVNFGEIYFHKICEKFNWKIDVASIEEIKKLEKGLLPTISIKLSKNGYSFSIVLIKKAHAYVQLGTKDRGRVVEIDSQDYLNRYQQNPVMLTTCMALYPISFESEDFIKLNRNNFFCLNLENNDKRAAAIIDTLNLIAHDSFYKTYDSSSASKFDNQYLERLVLGFPILPDLQWQKKLLGNFIKEAHQLQCTNQVFIKMLEIIDIKQGLSFDLKYNLVELNCFLKKNAEELLILMNKISQSGNLQEKNDADRLFNEFIICHYGASIMKQQLPEALIIIEDKKYNISEIAIMLILEVAIANDFKLPEILKFILKNILNINDTTPYQTIICWTNPMISLISKNGSFDFEQFKESMSFINDKFKRFTIIKDMLQKLTLIDQQTDNSKNNVSSSNKCNTY